MFKGKSIVFKATVLFLFPVAVLVLGLGLAIWIMGEVKFIAIRTSDKNIPAVQIANEIERTANAVILASRNYSLTEEKAFLEDSQVRLRSLNEGLKSAKGLAENQKLEWLKSYAENAIFSVDKYTNILDETGKVTDEMGRQKAIFVDAANEFNRQCQTFLHIQMNALQSVAEASTPPPDIADTAVGAEEEVVPGEMTPDLLERIRVGNEILAVCDSVQIDVWRAIAKRDAVLFEESKRKLVESMSMFDELKNITRKEVDLKQIETCHMTGQECITSMEAFEAVWKRRAELDKMSAVAGEEILVSAKTMALEGLVQTADGATATTGSLARGIWLAILALIGGLLISLISSISLTRELFAIKMTLDLERLAREENTGQAINVDSSPCLFPVNEREAMIYFVAAVADIKKSLDEIARNTSGRG